MYIHTWSGGFPLPAFVFSCDMEMAEEEAWRWDLDATVEFILKNGHKSVSILPDAADPCGHHAIHSCHYFLQLSQAALQFPDSMLACSTAVSALLSQRLGSQCRIYVLAVRWGIVHVTQYEPNFLCLSNGNSGIALYISSIDV